MQSRPFTRAAWVTLVTGMLLASGFGPAAASDSGSVDATMNACLDAHAEHEHVPGTELTSVRVERVDAKDPSTRVVTHALCAVDANSEGDFSVASDCSSRAFELTGWAWASAYSAHVDATGSGLDETDVLAAFRGAGESWDDVTADGIFSGVTLGGSGADAGTRDGVNQIGFQNIGGSGTVAQTTTWYSYDGTARESDGVYNTYYAWSTTGEGHAMDVQGVATHEIGHTFGLTHPPNDADNSCLSMYYRTPRGNTAARSLGDGDVIGIQELYGARAPPAPEPAPAPEPFTAGFRPKAGNAWWVEVFVDANHPVARVDAIVNDGAPRALTLRSWGGWAATFHVPDGSKVTFRATAEDGTTVTASDAWQWPDASPWKDAAPAPAPAPEAPFTVDFTPKAGNAWWVEVFVDANRPLERVTATVDGATHVLSLRSWGAWAASFHVPDGSEVTFTAVATDGSTQASDGAWSWPDATPVPAFEPTFTKGASNAWWVEVFVDADRPVTGVTATVDGGTPVPLAHKSWGAWAKSFHVPAGSRIVFTAYASDDAVARSQAYAWP